MDFVVRTLAIGPGARVLDLAAGTGKLTRQLLYTGADLVAVEPLEGMRRSFSVAVPAGAGSDGSGRGPSLSGCRAGGRGCGSGLALV